MKVLSRTRIWNTIATALLLALISTTIQPTEACERQCQLNVSHAFADKYRLLSSQYFSTLSTKIDQSLFHGVPTTAYSSTEATNAILHLQEAVIKAQRSWDVSLFRMVFDTIFEDEPKFKGDCNEPHRVNQPSLGVNWTMADCHAMDYICGNPPSICHFMPMIKTRIERKLTDQLETKIGGSSGIVGGGVSEDGGGSADEADVYANFLGPALSKVVMTHPKLEVYQAAMHGNLNEILEIVRDQIVAEAAFLAPGAEPIKNERWRPEWDLEIKLLLLSFP
ncbi:hypothetical protein BG015_009348 [Linnemannia schmuckeri]|uniref:Uncharacterized protein n=1 Tax=Linnemannia schmuckeri TaxID=64567 RepID=A0A9P5S7C0_9FUNG|nr:hypothetical protein BG015_009348 [Linnemannia schmuckeri]